MDENTINGQKWPKMGHSKTGSPKAPRVLLTDIFLILVLVVLYATPEQKVVNSFELKVEFQRQLHRSCIGFKELASLTKRGIRCCLVAE
jgi:hypothetical protein